VNHNGSKYLANCLKSVRNSSYDPFEIIFVDNASTDDSIVIVQELFKNDRITIVRNPSNLGFAKGNNMGARYAKGDYLVFLNNDTEVEPCWLNELVKKMESDPRIGVAQSKLLQLGCPQDRQIFDSTGDFIDFYGVGIRRGAGQVDQSQYENIEEVFSARGACMIVRRRIIKDVGLFDGDFFMGFEDVDLCWRIRLKGYKVMYVPKSVVYHKGSGTPSNIRAFHDQKNVFLLMMKNYDIFNLVLHLPPHLIFTLGAFVLDIFYRRTLVLALRKLRVVSFLLLNLRHIMTKRYIIQYLIRRVPDREIKKMMLQSNLALYTRYMLEVHRASGEKLRHWYFFMANPARGYEKEVD